MGLSSSHEVIGLDIFKTWRAKVEKETEKAVKTLHTDKGGRVLCRLLHSILQEGKDQATEDDGTVISAEWGGRMQEQNYSGNEIGYAEGERSSSRILE